MKPPHAKLAYDRLSDPSRISSMYNQGKVTKNQHGTTITYADESIMFIGKKVVKWKYSKDTNWTGERAL